MNDILDDLVNEDGMVTIESVCKKVTAWYNNESISLQKWNLIDAMLEFIREKALKLA